MVFFQLTEARMMFIQRAVSADPVCHRIQLPVMPRRVAEGFAAAMIENIQQQGTIQAGRIFCTRSSARC